jgi:hypothetical protein
MRLIALDTERSLRDMVGVFHYAYIDDMTASLVAETLYVSLKEDLGHDVDINEQAFALLMTQIIKESLNSYIDSLLKAVINNATHAIFEAITNNQRFSIQIDTSIHEQNVVSHLFNIIRPELSFLVDTSRIIYESMSIVLDRLKEKNSNNLAARTMQFINIVQPQLSCEPIKHIVRTELINANTIAMMVL